MANILYITYIDIGNQTSGSGVRPTKIYEAMLAQGHKVKLLEGQQNKRKQRILNVIKIFSWLKTNQPDLCYIESPTGPIFNSIDLFLIRKIYKKNIPIGFFYRDVLWKFNMHTPIGRFGKIKGKIIYLMHLRDWQFLKRYIKKLYFPSELVIDQFGRRKNMLELPPGCLEREVSRTHHDSLTAIYIGGVNERYGTQMMLDAFELVNKKIALKLILVCREQEWKTFCKENNIYENPDWLIVRHISGDDALSVEMNKSDFALIPLKNISYHQGAFPIKMTDYLSVCLPVITTDCPTMKSFVEVNKIGLVAKYDSSSFASKIVELAENEELRKDLENNCRIARRENLWTKRVEQVIDDLINN